MVWEPNGWLTFFRPPAHLHVCTDTDTDTDTEALFLVDYM